MAQPQCERRALIAPRRGWAARLVAALAMIAALFAARGAAAEERLPGLGRVIERLPGATCRVALDSEHDLSTPPPEDGSSVLDTDPPPPALAVPRARSGPDGRPGTKDAVIGATGLVVLSGAPASRFDEDSAGRAAPIREQAWRSRRLPARHARGPPAARA